MAEHESREVWAKRVERWGDSGLTAGEFATELGINARTLKYWKWKLGTEQRSAKRPRTPGEPAPAASAGVDFIEVRPQPAAVHEPFELVVGAVTVRVPCAFDPNGLRRLLEVVRA
jgi:hypothetical protein